MDIIARAMAAKALSNSSQTVTSASFASFEIDLETGELKMKCSDDYDNSATFSIDDNGILEVTL